MKRDRGYPRHLVTRAIDSVPFHKRESLLTQANKEPCPYETFLVVKYTPDLDVKQIQSILKPDELEKDKIPKPCLSCKKAKSLAQKPN